MEVVKNVEDDDKESPQELLHIAEPLRKRKYDPVKRKEYYERTKKLKGRKKGKSNWAKNLQYDTQKGIENMKKRKQNPLQMKIKGASKTNLEDAMDSLARARKSIRERGFAGSEQDKLLEKLQIQVANEYFKNTKESYGNGAVRITVDRHGNTVELPDNISSKMFLDLNWNARNDFLPDLQNPVKDFNLRSPFKKSKENPIKVGGDITKILPDDKPATPAPKGWKPPRKSAGRIIQEELHKDRQFPWEKKKGQVEDRRGR